MGMCCEKMMIGWRNVRSMKLRVKDQEEDQRGPGEVVREDCQARKMNKVDAIDRCKWRKMIEDVRWSGWVWVSECFLWYWPTRIVPHQRPLNGCVCVCVCVCVCGENSPTGPVADSENSPTTMISSENEWHKLPVKILAIWLRCLQVDHRCRRPDSLGSWLFVLASLPFSDLACRWRDMLPKCTCK